MSGAVTRQVAIGDLPYTLVFKFGTMRLAEAELGGKSVWDVFSEGFSAEAISAIFWAALQPGHQMIRTASDELIDTLGPKAALTEITAGLAAYFDAGSADAGNGTEPPATSLTPTPTTKRKPKPTA